MIGFHRGMCATVYAIRSVVSRIDGPGGKTYVPRDRYSLTMSFCVVPASRPTASAGSAPACSACSSATTWYSASSHIAVALIVIDVFIAVSGMPSNSRAHVAQVRDRHPDLADLAAGQRVVGVVAGLGGQVEGDRQPGLPLGEVQSGTARWTRPPTSAPRRSA